MTSQPRAFFAIDHGSATTSAALLGHVGGRWRLISHTSAPSSVDVEALLTGLLNQIRQTDRALFDEIAADEIAVGEIRADEADTRTYVATWPRLNARTTPPRRVAVLAGSRRQRRRLEECALRAGWLVASGSADEDDPVALSRLMLSPTTNAVLLGADDSPGGDEKRHLPDLAALVAAATRLRPELTVILAGGAAAFEMAFASSEDDRSTALSLDTPQPETPGMPDKGPVQTKIAATVTPSAETSGDVDGEDAKPPAAEDASDAAAALEPDATQAAAPEPDASDAVAAVEPDVPPTSEVVSETSVAEAPEDPTATAEETAELPVVGAVSTPEAPTSTIDLSTESHGSAHVLLAPDAGAGQPAGSALQQILEGLRADQSDSRLAVARSIASLAYVLDRSIEVVEVGLQGGLRARSEPVGQGHLAVVSSHVCPAEASFAPPDPSEEVVDGVVAWSTETHDRHRLMDRLDDLRLTPWGEAEGGGAVFRLAAAKAAVARLVEATPEINAHPMPQLLVAAGGIFGSLPPSVVALALADLIRRPGVSNLACDQARLLGPLGVVEDEAERRRLLANLADDILVPLGSLILPAGVKNGRSAGHLKLNGSVPTSEIELHPGAVQVVDLPPGQTAKVDLDFRDTVRLTDRGHRFSVDVAGGLAGLLIDLRDIPLRISDRPESRRAALEAWQRGMWPEVDE